MKFECFVTFYATDNKQAADNVPCLGQEDINNLHTYIYMHLFLTIYKITVYKKIAPVNNAVLALTRQTDTFLSLNIDTFCI